MRLVHAIFSTKDRRPWLPPAGLREELHRYLGGILPNLECQPIIVGGTPQAPSPGDSVKSEAGPVACGLTMFGGRSQALLSGHSSDF